MTDTSHNEKQTGAMASLNQLVGAMVCESTVRDLARKAVGDWPAVVQIHDGRACVVAGGGVVGSVPAGSLAHRCIDAAIVEHHQAHVARIAVEVALGRSGLSALRTEPEMTMVASHEGRGLYVFDHTCLPTDDLDGAVRIVRAIHTAWTSGFRSGQASKEGRAA